MQHAAILFSILKWRHKYCVPPFSKWRQWFSRLQYSVPYTSSTILIA
jgi:hypothetical protein